MAGHSQFKNIMHRKGAQDAKRAKLFTKIIREIIVAAKSGQVDPNFNPRLRNALLLARTNNMPKDKVENAIKKASQGNDGDNYEEIRYEAYAPGGVALIIEALTDNRNRTASEVRSTISKNGGNLGETNSVSFLFSYCGAIEYDKEVFTSFDQAFEAAIEAGADNIEELDEGFSIICEKDKLNDVRDFLNKAYGEAKSVKLVWLPGNYVAVDGENAEKLYKLIEVLEDNDDVQNVYGNYEFNQEFLSKMN